MANDLDPYLVVVQIGPEFVSVRNTWRDALHYYHLAVRGELERALGEPATSRDRAGRLLAPPQRPDGSFANASPLMKEDDPILSTALVVVALE